mgnify:CR=1 FL=1
MRFDIMTLFPDVVRCVLDSSIIGRAQSGGIIEVECHNIRDYTLDKHRKGNKIMNTEFSVNMTVFDMYKFCRNKK